MEKKLFYLEDNSSWIDIDSNVIKQLEYPLYENIKFDSIRFNQLELYDIYGSEDLMNHLLRLGERVYYSIKSDIVKSQLVIVSDVEITTNADDISVKYTFENGQVFKRDNIFEFEYYDEKDVPLIIELLQKMSKHIFYVNCNIPSNMFEYEYERWG